MIAGCGKNMGGTRFKLNIVCTNARCRGSLHAFIARLRETRYGHILDAVVKSVR